MLTAQGITLEPEAFSDSCHRAREASTALGSTLAAFFGCVYIQDRASMLPPLALMQARGGSLQGVAILDMCASPGGKSSFLAQLAGSAGFVLSNEPNRERAQTLRRNLTRMNLANTASCQYSGERLPLPDASWTDILLDPPCSGWGTAEKNPQVHRLWREEKIDPLVKLQRLLLREAARLLAPGGRLVYSTCTTNWRENEEQVLWAMAECGLELAPLHPLPGLACEPSVLPEAQGCLRIDQERSQAQGHFAACLAKPGTAAPLPVSDANLPGEAPPADILAGLWRLERLGPGAPRRFLDTVHFVHRTAQDLLPGDFRWQGLPLGRVSGAGFREFARARLLLPAEPDAEAMVFDSPEPIRRLLSGQSLEARAGGGRGSCGLYYAAGGSVLGLGWLRRKGKRVLWSER